MLSPSSRRIRGRYGLVACGVVVGLIWAQSAWAQSTAQIPLQFDFMNPGARSLGMGGAFVGGADDASAAYANPAGLTQIMTKEFSVEGRFRSVDTTFLRGGRVSGVVTGVGADVIAGPSYGTDRDRHTSPAFLSLVMPVGHVTVAAYRHEAVGIENSFFSEGPFERATFVECPRRHSLFRSDCPGGRDIVRWRSRCPASSRHPVSACVRATRQGPR